MIQHNMPYRILKAKRSNTTVFVNAEDPEDLEAARAHCGNQDLQLSAAHYEEPDPSSPCSSSLYFRATSYSIDQARRGIVGIRDYAAEHFAVPEVCLEVVYDGGGSPGNDPGRQGQGGRRSGLDDSTPAEFVVSISPGVFSPRPTTLIPAINHHLARQLSQEGIGVEVDVYAQEQQSIPLIGSINGATGRYVTSLSTKELLYLDVNGLLELSNQPRSDDSYVAARHVPQTAAWFAKTLQEEETRQRWQSQLRQMLSRSGWQIPPCVRRLHWADLSEHQVLEVCRIMAQFYPFIHAAEDETWNQILRLERRYGIGDRLRLKAIVAFGSENPGFPGCNDPLLQRFCPATRCHFADMRDEYVNPRLFT